MGGLAMDSIAAAHSGHLGLPLGCAEIGSVLYGSQMKYNPKDSTWMNRDRFILSAGHGSMFLYSWLNLAGFDLSIEELKNFRQHHSQTPGHPEFPNSEHTTPGIECTTGPLGAGVANAVGFAVSEKMAAARYNTDDHTIFDHHIFALAGDGCFQEGVSAESATFAAHEKLDNLIILYDSNEVTLDKMAEYTQSEDIMKRYDAYGWETYEIDGHDLTVVEETIAVAKAKANIGLPEEGWFVSEGTRDFFAGVQEKNSKIYDDWTSTFASWKEANPDLAKELEDAISDTTMPAEEMIKAIGEQSTDAEATRVSGYKIIQDIAKLVPNYVSGSADLHGSTRNYIDNGGNFGAGFDKTYAGKNLYFGIREHAMGAMLNGMAYH